VHPSLLRTKKGVFSGSTIEDSLYTPQKEHTLYLIANQAGQELLFPQWENDTVKSRLFPPQCFADREDNLDWNGLTWLNKICTKHKTSLPTEDPSLRPKPLRALMAQAEWSPCTPHQPKDIPTFPPLPLHWHPTHHSIYTDGSCLQHKLKNLCGAGIYIPSQDKCITIDPRGKGETNTINRAELMAILAATSPEVTPLQQDVYIFTDSICSELQINKYLMQPEKFRFHTHRDLICQIAEQTRDRALAGGRTHILKVKGHAGIRGNEKADAVAGLARKLVAEGKETDMHGGMIEAEPRHHIYWPFHQGQSLPNLKQAPRSLARKCRQDLDLCTGLYQRLHMKACLIWGPGATQYIISRGTDQKTRTHLCKFLGGSLYNGKIEARNAGKPNWEETKCICCNEMDGQTHTMSGCKHPKMKGCYINRHDSGVRALAKFLKESKHPHIGKAVHIMDAGRGDKADGFMGTRVPEWMLPKDDTQWTHRPDILLLIPEHDDPTPINEFTTVSDQVWRIKEDYTVLIIEVGYTSDYRLQEKDVEKQAQHTLLATKLKQQGWRSPNHQGVSAAVDILSIPIGVCGRYLEETHQHIQRQLAMPHETATRLLQRMGGIGVDSFVGIYLCKRLLDRELRASRNGSG
jgi:ribonuclease HI